LNYIIKSVVFHFFYKCKEGHRKRISLLTKKQIVTYMIVTYILKKNCYLYDSNLYIDFSMQINIYSILGVVMVNFFLDFSLF